MIAIARATTIVIGMTFTIISNFKFDSLFYDFLSNEAYTFDISALYRLKNSIRYLLSFVSACMVRKSYYIMGTSFLELISVVEFTKGGKLSITEVVLYVCLQMNRYR